MRLPLPGSEREIIQLRGEPLKALRVQLKGEVSEAPLHFLPLIRVLLPHEEIRVAQGGEKVQPVRGVLS